MVEKKKFEACLLRLDNNAFAVAQWNYLVTTVDKNKLNIGSNVGYRKGGNKREKSMRGAIVVIGTTKLCEQQMKLLTEKTRMKKIIKKKSNISPEDKETSDSDREDSSQSNVEESSDENLQINEQEEISDDDQPEEREIAEINISNKKRQIETKTTEEENLDIADEDEPTTNTIPGKRSSDVVELKNPAPKRSFISFARFEELQAENSRLKKMVQKYETTWMPRPTDPGAINYLVSLRDILLNDFDQQERTTKLESICVRLNIAEEQLIRLKKDNGTKSARAIVRAFYPPSTRADTNVEDIEDEFLYAIHDFIKLFHGMEFLTIGQINESVHNVFRSAKNQKKEKELKNRQTNLNVQSSQPVVNNSDNIKSKTLSNSRGKENICTKKK